LQGQWYGLVHLGLRTFAPATEPPAFAPSRVDVAQWVKTCKDTGMAGVVLVARERNGFCLWPSPHSQTTVAAAPWRGGRGDLVAEVSTTCRRLDMMFGVQIEVSAADQDDTVLAQLRDLLTNYGDLAVVRVVGTSRERHAAMVAAVRRHQPRACVISPFGPDIRETVAADGHLPDSHWATLPVLEAEDRTPPPALDHGDPHGQRFVPAVSITPLRTRFEYDYADEFRQQPVAGLLTTYERSVGRGGTWLLGLAIDQHGVVATADGQRLRELRAALAAMFGTDLARTGTASSDDSTPPNPQHGAGRAVDGDPTTYWASDAGRTHATLTIRFSAARVITHVVIAEAIDFGQRVSAFTLQVEDADGWHTLHTGGTIGSRRIVALAPTATQALRLQLTAIRPEPRLHSVNVFCSPPQVRIDAASAFLQRTLVELSSDQPGAVIHYTLDGREPTRNAPRYEGAIALERSATVRAVAFVGDVRSLHIAEKTLQRFTDADLRDGVHFLVPPPPGLAFTCDGRTDAPMPRGVCDRPTLTDDLPHGEVRWRGHLLIPDDGVWAFTIVTTTAVELRLHDQPCVAVAALSGERIERTGMAPLRAGYHPVEVIARHPPAAGAPGVLEVHWQGPHRAREAVPATQWSQ